jgi:hypothetical protein
MIPAEDFDLLYFQGASRTYQMEPPTGGNVSAQYKWLFSTALEAMHPDHSLLPLKLTTYSKLSDKQLIDSLKPGQPGSLKARPDGAMIDGHHRIKILRDRGVDVDSLPREIVPKDRLAVLFKMFPKRQSRAN